jgi:hypothetical protein
MEYFKELLDKRHVPQMVLSILFIVYLLVGYKMPEGVAQVVDTTIGKVVVGLVSLLLFAYGNPILGVLGLLVAYQLIQSASVKTGMAALEEYYPTEEKKWSPFSPAHQFPYTLEQEVVKNMTTQKFNTEYVKAPWRPVLDDTHDATFVNSM